jgi:hypothetical protein
MSARRPDDNSAMDLFWYLLRPIDAEQNISDWAYGYCAECK